MKIWKRCLCSLLAGIIISAAVCGCSKQRDYGEEYNYETDYQHSYFCNVDGWRKIQSDGDGQYILKNKYIYYYNTEKKTLTPLCNKANCLHDMETDESRQDDCNAYASTDKAGGSKYIQYYDGYIYYVANDWDECSLYRLKKDGSQKDKIFTTDDKLTITDWLIHRGYFYYILQTYQIESENGSYSKQALKSLELSSNMSEKKAKIIEQSDDDNVTSFSRLKAYKNYLCYQKTADDAGSGKAYTLWYIYNIEAGQSSVISAPEGNSETTHVNRVVFMKDRMLLELYDQQYDLTDGHKLPIYSINYDLTDAKIWLDAMDQGMQMQSYDDYVIFSDAFSHWLPQVYAPTVSDGDLISEDDWTYANMEIYSSDAKRVSYFVYPMNVMGNFNGFGPDGVNVEFDEDDYSWSVYELNFKDVLNCKGEEVKLEKVSTRRFGTLNKEEY